MTQIFSSRIRLGIILIVLSSFLVSCATQANSKYWGQVDVPQDNVMRYITGSEPESLDPQFVTGQPEARILIGLYDRLVEYHPKTLQPIPSMATSWENADNLVTYTFNLRKDGKFSNGDPIKAEDFAWSFRRALSPELASRYAFLGYDIKYAEAYNSGKSFVKKDGKFLLAKDFEEKPNKQEPITEDKPKVLEKEEFTETAPGIEVEKPDTANSGVTPDVGQEKTETEFQKYINSPERLVLVEPTDEDTKKAIEELTKENPRLKAALEGAEYIPVKAEDIGVEAVDDYTLQITLKQPAPYFVGVLTHQFFAALHKPTIEKFGKDWIKPENIVTSGAFKVSEWKPYDELTIVRDPNYWDAKNVHLDAIVFYPMDEQTTMMNIYKSGRVDAIYNHTVPAAWNEYIRQFGEEYQLHPEVASEYYTFSVKKPPVDKVEVRRAFSLAVNRQALEDYRKTIKKSADFTPPGIFPEYDKARKKVYDEKIKAEGITPEEFEKRFYNPAKACELMEKAGYTVKKNGEKCKVTDFPADDIQLSYNTAESNKQVAEFIQAQWKQNLGITVQLKNMEWKTYLPYRSSIEYTGMARAGWVGDFMDPYTFLSQFYSPKNDSSTGWWDPKFDEMLDAANNTKDPTARLEKLAEAEFYLLQDMPVIPLAAQGTSWMKKPYIKGMYPNPGTMHPWKFVYIERDKSKWDVKADDIMEQGDPQVDAETDALMKSQMEFEKSNSPENEKSSDSKKVEE
ncbi:MAG: peptide ABC transporter substrate-binding protein [Aridibacter sp.]